MLRIKCENGVTLKFWVGSIKIVPDLDTSYLTNRLYPFHIESHHAKFQLNPFRNGVVDTDALLSSSPSLIWLQLGFGLTGAMTISAI